VCTQQKKKNESTEDITLNIYGTKQMEVSSPAHKTKKQKCSVRTRG